MTKSTKQFLLMIAAAYVGVKLAEQYNVPVIGN